MSWKHLEDVLKVSIQGALKTFFKSSSRHLSKASSRRLQDVFEDDLKASWRRLEDVPLWRIYWSCSGCLQDVLKTSSEDLWSRGICWSWSRRLQDVFTKTNVCWEWSLKKYWRWACRKYQSKKHMEFLLDPTA